MFGNIISNAEIEAMVKGRALTISPFDRKNLKLAHYRIGAGRLLRPRQGGSTPQSGSREVHDFSNEERYEFQPNEYLVVEAQQFLQLPAGIVGNFLPASALIEQGFGLTAGKLDPGFGGLDGKSQHVRFGLKNQLNEPNVFDRSRGLAHIFFVNLTGLRTSAVTLTRQEIRAILDDQDPHFRRHNDDGVAYPEEDEF